MLYEGKLLYSGSVSFVKQCAYVHAVTRRL